MIQAWVPRLPGWVFPLTCSTMQCSRAIVERTAPTFSGGHLMSGQSLGIEWDTLTRVVNGGVVAGIVPSGRRRRPAASGPGTGCPPSARLIRRGHHHWASRYPAGGDRAGGDTLPDRAGRFTRLHLRHRLALRLSLDVGLWHDGGDAETGAGVDIGGGLIVSDPLLGLSADVRVRMLLVHQAEGFQDRGVSMAFSTGARPRPT